MNLVLDEQEPGDCVLLLGTWETMVSTCARARVRLEGGKLSHVSLCLLCSIQAALAGGSEQVQHQVLPS